MSVRRREEDEALPPFIELEARYAETSIEDFDRLAYAMSLAQWAFPGARIAACPGGREVQVMSGRRWGEAATARWVLVSVPKSASRKAIATAITERSRGTAPAYFYDTVYRGNIG